MAMIQIKRGSTSNWKKLKTPLADGQPGYDRDKHRLKIGDGKHLWDKLKPVGLTEEELIDSEINAKARRLADPESVAIITYGTEFPDKNTIGELYLQQYESDPEVDYIIACGETGIWQYQIWKSGFARCWGGITISTSIENSIGKDTLYTNDNDVVMRSIEYPFTFKKATSGVKSHVETATITGAENKIVWLASKIPSSVTHSGVYTILSCNKQQSANYTIVLDVKGRIDLADWQKQK